MNAYIHFGYKSHISLDASYIPSLRIIFVVVVVVVIVIIIIVIIIIVVVVVVVVIIIIGYTLGTHKALNFGYYRHKFACALHAN